MHPRCLHSFSSERRTWTSGDRTQVNVYLPPFLSGCEFALSLDRKPLASPLSFSAVFLSVTSAVAQQFGHKPDKVSRNCQKNKKTTRCKVDCHREESRLMNVFCELYRLRLLLLTIDLCSERLITPNLKCNKRVSYHFLSGL